MSRNVKNVNVTKRKKVNHTHKDHLSFIELYTNTYRFCGWLVGCGRSPCAESMHFYSAL
jgi:hypothetical protein